MVDAFAIMKANREGYELYSIREDSEENFFFRKGGQEGGPFKNLDEAAYAAISHAEEEVLKSFWERKDNEGS